MHVCGAQCSRYCTPQKITKGHDKGAAEMGLRQCLRRHDRRFANPPMPRRFKMQLDLPLTSNAQHIAR